MENINRGQEEIKDIEKYVNSLKEFRSFIDMKSDNTSDLLTKIATKLKYEKVEKDKVICKFGEKGSKFYLILKGKIGVIIPKLEKIKMTQNEYFDYLIRLKKFKEKDILIKVLPLNKNAYPLEDEEISWLKGEIRTINPRKNETNFEKYFKIFSFMEYQIELNNQLNNYNNNNSRNPNKKHSSKKVLLGNSNSNKNLLKNIKIDLKDKELPKEKQVEKEKEKFIDFCSKEADWKIFEDEKYQYSTVRYQQTCSVDEYINNNLPLPNMNSNVNTNDKNKISRKKTLDEDIKELSVYSYHNICDLATGNKFGDVALVAINQKRTASIISKDLTHFGVFEKRDFLRIINDVNDKQKKREIKIIQHQQVFSSINVNVFQWNYFNLFANKKFKRGDKITTEFSSIDSIYVVKDGLFEVTIKKSNLELLDLINKLGGKVENNIKLEDLKYENEAFNNFMREKKVAKIEIIKDNDIIGLEDMTLDDKYLFTIDLQSIEGEVYELKKEFFEKMMKSNNNMRVNNSKFCKTKRQYWLDRLQTIYDARIDFYKKFKIKKADRREIPESDEQNYTEEPKLENDEIFKEKVNMNSTQMNFESKHLKEIDEKGKSKIKSPQKKKKNWDEESEGQKLYKLALYRIHEEKKIKFLEGLKEKKEQREREIEYYRNLYAKKNSNIKLNGKNMNLIGDSDDNKNNLALIKNNMNNEDERFLQTERKNTFNNNNLDSTNLNNLHNLNLELTHTNINNTNNNINNTNNNINNTNNNMNSTNNNMNNTYYNINLKNSNMELMQSSIKINKKNKDFFKTELPNYNNYDLNINNEYDNNRNQNHLPYEKLNNDPLYLKKEILNNMLYTQEKNKNKNNKKEENNTSNKDLNNINLNQNIVNIFSNSNNSNAKDFLSNNINENSEKNINSKFYNQINSSLIDDINLNTKSKVDISDNNNNLENTKKTEDLLEENEKQNINKILNSTLAKFLSCEKKENNNTIYNNNKNKSMKKNSSKQDPIQKGFSVTKLNFGNNNTNNEDILYSEKDNFNLNYLEISNTKNLKKIKNKDLIDASCNFNNLNYINNNNNMNLNNIYSITDSTAKDFYLNNNTIDLNNLNTNSEYNLNNNFNYYSPNVLNKNNNTYTDFNNNLNNLETRNSLGKKKIEENFNNFYGGCGYDNYYDNKNIDKLNKNFNEQALNSLHSLNIKNQNLNFGGFGYTDSNKNLNSTKKNRTKIYNKEGKVVEISKKIQNQGGNYNQQKYQYYNQIYLKDAKSSKNLDYISEKNFVTCSTDKSVEINSFEDNLPRKIKNNDSFILNGNNLNSNKKHKNTKNNLYQNEQENDNLNSEENEALADNYNYNDTEENYSNSQRSIKMKNAVDLMERDSGRIDYKIDINNINNINNKERKIYEARDFKHRYQSSDETCNKIISNQNKKNMRNTFQNFDIDRRFNNNIKERKIYDSFVFSGDKFNNNDDIYNNSNEKFFNKKVRKSFVNNKNYITNNNSGINYSEGKSNLRLFQDFSEEKQEKNNNYLSNNKKEKDFKNSKKKETEKFKLEAKANLSKNIQIFKHNNSNMDFENINYSDNLKTIETKNSLEEDEENANENDKNNLLLFDKENLGVENQEKNTFKEKEKEKLNVENKKENIKENISENNKEISINQNNKDENNLNNEDNIYLDTEKNTLEKRKQRRGHEDKGSSADFKIDEINSNQNQNDLNNNNSNDDKINKKEILNTNYFEKKKKMFLIDELDKITQSTKYNEYSSKKDLNKRIYDQVFSEMLMNNNEKEKDQKSISGTATKFKKKESPFIDYLAVDKFNEVYSTSFKRTMGFFNKDSNNKLSKVISLNSPSPKNENLLEKMKYSNCMSTRNLQNVISKNILPDQNTKFSTFYSNSTYGSFNENPQLRSYSTSLYLMNDKAKKIYQPKKFMRFMPKKKF